MDNQELLKRAFFEIQKLKQETAVLKSPIAVVGIGCQFPGKVQNIEDYWNLITSKTDATQNISDERWHELLKINPELEETISSRNGGYLDRVDLFDANFFQITPREAKLMDPQHRFLLEVAWQAMENGNTTLQQLQERKTGVFIGMTLSDYGQLTINEASNDTYGLTGSAMNAGAGRVAYLLGLNGPAITYDTACSSSLVALDGAIKSLRSGDADCAFAGGVNLITGPNSSIFIAKAAMSSPDGRCYSFDQKASGMARGEGCGMVLLKRLDDAIADGDTIYSVIRDSAINNNGNGSGFTVPNGPMQVSLMQSVYENLGITPQEVDYVEAHGTGTSLGDPIEINALQEVYGKQRVHDHPLFVGSVKTNLGHLESAAGIAGFIKASLALYHKTIPPQLFFETPNQHINWESINIRIATEAKKWEANDSIRRAAVSSFGASGTNAHIVLEEGPKSTREIKSSLLQKAVLTISSANQKALKAQVEQWINYLKSSTTSYTDICYSSNCSRSHLSTRLSLIAKDTTDAIEKLERFLNDEPVNDIKTCDVILNGKIKTSWIFTGQGAQYAEMGKNLYENFPTFKLELDTCNRIYEEVTQKSLISILFASNDDSQLGETIYTQPAIFCLEYALAKLLISWGMKPDLMIGHSVGEYVAATIAGVFKLEDAIRIIAKRGELIQSLPKEGTMAVLFANEASVRPLLVKGAGIAALNSPENTVVSGEIDAVRETLKNGLALGIKGKELTVSHAFHSELMTPILSEFKQQFEHIKLSKPQIPIVSNVTGKVESELFTTAQYWTDHIREAVNFIEGINVAIQHGCNAYIEIGPTQTLIHSAQQIAGVENKSVWTPTLSKDKSDTDALLSTLAVLHTHHFPVEWERIHGEVFPKASIPLYEFQRESYWVKAQEFQRTILTEKDEKAIAPSSTTTRIIALEDRRAYLSREIAQMIHQATDIDPEQMDYHAHFFQSGLDSIILITIRQEIERRFKVAIAMGMFYEETSTIHLLTEFIFQKAPESIYTLSAEIPPQKKIEAPLTLKTPKAKPAASDAFVPYKKINTKTSGSLSKKALDSLNTLIENINKRTPRSKEQTAHYRDVLANNRAVAGFKPEWKEMLYQIITNRAEGSKIWDIDGNEYIDLTMGFGVQFFGHNPSFIMDSVNNEIKDGFTVGPMSHLTGEVAEQFCQITGMDRAAFYNSGTEAIMVAMRLARAYTNKDKIVIFSGSYHGTFDGVLAISSDEHAIPMVPGTTQGTVDDIVVLKYGDKESLKIIESMKNELAAVIVEPVQSRRPDLQPKDFLHAIKAISAANDFALIFDEVITGFRAHPQGAQGVFGVEADLAVYGKVIGGGLPIGIVGGKSRYLDAIDGGHWKYGDNSYPSVRTTFAAGTFCHHPLALAAARSVLQRIKKDGPEMQENLNEKTRQLSAELNAFFVKESLPIKITQFASLFRFVLSGNGELLYYKLLEKGIYVWEGRNCFLSTAHSDEDIRRIIDIVKESALELKEAELIQSTEVHERSVSSTQNRVFMLSQNEQGEQGYQLPEIFELIGKVDVNKIEAVFNQLIDRHENLRSSFILRNDEVVQRIHTRVDFKLVTEKRHNATTKELIESISQPFDLSHPSLIRVKLVEVNPEEFRLVFNIHHIVFDGFSMISLLKDFVSLYQGYALPPLVSNYGDFVQWEKDYKQSSEFEKDAAFWIEKFQGEIPQIELPTDRRRTVEPSFQGNSVHVRISKESTDKIRSFARSEGVSMYMLTLSAFYLLLNRYSGQDDLVIGTPVGGRSKSEFRDIIGMFVNTIALRESIDAEQSVSDFIGQVSKSNLSAFEYENYPFDDLYKRLNVERIPSRNPLFDVFFAYEAHEALSVDLGDMQLKWVDPIRLTSKFDLKLEIQDSDQLDIYLGYKTALYDESSISQMSSHYAQLLQNIIENSDKPINRLSMISSKEEEQLLHTFNNTSVTYDKSVLLIDLFEQIAAKKENKTALVEGDRSMSYGEVNSLSNQLIYVLQEQFSLKEGDVVAILLPRCIEGICGALAALKGACAFMFVDINYPKDRIEHMLTDSGANVILSFPEYFELVPADEKRKLLDIRSIENIETPQNPHRNPENTNPLAYLIYTSGSTGKPKGTLIPNQAILNYTRGIINKMEFTDQDEALHLLATGFDAGFTYVWSMLTVGGTLHIVKDKKEMDPEYIIDYIDKQNITFIKWIPTYFKLICQHDSFKNGAFNSLRILMLGGETVNASDLMAFKTAYPSVKLFDHYGPTESTVGCLGRWMTDDLERYSYEQVIGKPFENYKAYVFSDAMQLQPIGIHGELHIGGDSLAKGYNGLPELTASRFIPNPYIPGEIIYKTGDFVKRLPSGDIVFLQRKDNQIKINGYRIEIGEVQLAIQQVEGIRDVYITTRHNDTGAEILAYYIVNDVSLDPESVRQALTETLPEYMIPAHFMRVDSFPFNDHGKIDRTALPLPENIVSTSSSVDSDPQTDDERILAEIWGAVLNRESIGIDENYFSIGGDSIKSILIISRLRKQGLKLGMDALFNYPTIRQLATKLERNEATISQEKVTGTFPLTPIQRRFFAEQKEHITPFNLSFFLNNEEPWDIDAIKKTLGHLMNHHDMLRAEFNDSDVQTIQSESIIRFEEVLVSDLSTIDAELERIQKNIQPEDGVVIQATCFRSSEDEVVFISTHHLISDAISSRILLEDFVSVYQQMTSGQSLQLQKKTDSFKAWSEYLQKHTNSGAFDSQKSHWKTVVSSKVDSIKHEVECNSSYQSHRRFMRYSLNQQETDRLKQANGTFNTKTNELLLTAIARSTEAIFGIQQQAVMFEGHGREPLDSKLDITRTIGWFTSYFPAVIHSIESPTENLKEIKEIVRSIPDNGIGYDALVQIAKNSDLDYLPQLKFNYIGQIENTEKNGSISIRENKAFDLHSELLLQHDLEIVSLETNGELHIDLYYHSVRFTESTMDKWLTKIGEEIVSLTNNCLTIEKEKTPSDLIYSELTAELFAQLLASKGMKPSEVDDIYPVSSMQEVILFHSLSNPDAQSFVMDRMFSISGPLDIERFKESWQVILDKNELLRGIISTEYTPSPVQIIRKSVDIDFQFIDLINNESSLEHALNTFKSLPLDLLNGPLLRVAVFQTKPDHFKICWKYHHILQDGWSSGILLEQLFKYYENTDRSSIGAPYSEYIRWYQQQDLSLAKSFWEDRFSGYDQPATILPCEEILANENASFVDEEFFLSEEATANLESLGYEFSVTLNTLIQAIWSILCAKYSGSNDIVFGATVSGRPSAISGINEMVGLFINTVPVRVQLDPIETFKTFVQSFQEKNIQAERFHHYSLADIQSNTSVNNNLLDHVLIYENYPLEEEIMQHKGFSRGNLFIDDIHIDGNNPYNFSVEIVPGKQLYFKMIYNEKVIQKNFITRIHGDFKKLLEQLPMAKGNSLQSIESLIVTEAEIAQQHSFLDSMNDLDEDF